MSMYKTRKERKGDDDVRFRYTHFWGARRTSLMTFAVTLNLTNIKNRPHKSLPLDDEDEYIVVSPYYEIYFNNGYRCGYSQYKINDKAAFTCKIFR